LQRELSKSPNIVPLHQAKELFQEECYTAELDEMITGLTRKRNCSLVSVDNEQHGSSAAGMDDGFSTELDHSSDSETVEALKMKVAALEKANQQIYEFAASLIIDRS
uniref:FGFR1 oncogene partner 2 n=1 Tax=Gongylonema pulchrum TaxID=637853 RepID=A0A183DLU5_9BILA